MLHILVNPCSILYNTCLTATISPHTPRPTTCIVFCLPAGFDLSHPSCMPDSPDNGTYDWTCTCVWMRAVLIICTLQDPFKHHSPALKTCSSILCYFTLAVRNESCCVHKMVAAAPAISPEHLNESIAYQLLSVAISFMILDTLFVIVRFVSRRYEPAKLGFNDMFLILGWINCLALAADGLSVCYISAQIQST